MTCYDHTITIVNLREEKKTKTVIFCSFWGQNSFLCCAHCTAVCALSAQLLFSKGLSSLHLLRKLTWWLVYSKEDSPVEHKTEMVSDILWSCLRPWVYLWGAREDGEQQQQHWDHQGRLYLPGSESLMQKAPTNAWAAWCCHPGIFYHWSNISRQLL